MKCCSCLSNLQDRMIISNSGNCSCPEYMHAASVRQKWRGNKHPGCTQIPGYTNVQVCLHTWLSVSFHAFFLLLPNIVRVQRHCIKLLQFYVRLPFHSNVLLDARHYTRTRRFYRPLFTRC